MKLMKKVLPLASIAALGAIIAPMVTSCSTASFVDVLQYKPTQAAYDGEKKQFTQDEALDLYFNAINKNNAILQDDIFYGVNKGLPTSYFINHDFKLSYSKLNLHMSDIKLDTIECRASFKLDAQIVGIPNPKKDNQSLSINSTMFFKHIRFWMDPTVENKPTCFSLYGDNTDFQWSIEVTENILYRFPDFNYQASNAGKIDASSFYTAFKTFYTLEMFSVDNIKIEPNEIWVMFESNYLKNIKVSAQERGI